MLRYIGLGATLARAAASRAASALTCIRTADAGGTLFLLPDEKPDDAADYYQQNTDDDRIYDNRVIHCFFLFIKASLVCSGEAFAL